MDGFQRAMSVRKKRSKAFLESELAPFNIMLVLCFHHYMHRVSSSAFALHDSDKQGMHHQTQRARLQEKWKMRRLAFKGAQALNPPLEPKTEEPSLLNVVQNTHSVIDVFWKILENEEALEKTAFTVPTTFWPNNLAKADMMQRIAGDILKTIAALKWRVIQRARTAPYSLLEMAFSDSMDFIESKTTEFSEEKACCLDPHWGQVVQSYVLGQRVDDQAQCLQRIVKNFKENSRAVSSREESMHSVQRHKSKASNSQPAAFKRQAANLVLHSAMTNYTARTGIGLGTKGAGASLRVKKASTVVRKQKLSHQRPRQYGNAMFSYVAAQRAAGSERPAGDLRREWAALSEQHKEKWRRRLRLQVSMRRFAKSQAEGTQGNIQTHDDADGGKQKSPWNLGDDVYPLRPSYLSAFYTPFQQKVTGLVALKKIKEETNDVEVRDAIEHFESGKKYHSMDAAVKASKAKLGATINDDNWSTGSWGRVAACQREPKHCMEQHPGICKTRDERILPKVKMLCQSFPKKDMVLQLELSGRPARERVMIFAMLVVGALAESLWGWDCAVGVL